MTVWLVKYAMGAVPMPLDKQCPKEGCTIMQLLTQETRTEFVKLLGVVLESKEQLKLSLKERRELDKLVICLIAVIKNHTADLDRGTERFELQDNKIDDQGQEIQAVKTKFAGIEDRGVRLSIVGDGSGTLW